MRKLVVLELPEFPEFESLDDNFKTERFPVDEFGLEEAYRQVTDSLALMYEDWITSGNP